MTPDVVNALGHRVQRIEQGLRANGRHALLYTTEALQAGMYDLKLTHNDGIVSLPLLIAK